TRALSAASPALEGTSTNLVVNGSFEEPPISPGTIQYFSSLPGWQLAFGSSIELQNRAAGLPFDGNQLVELDSFDNTGIFQDLPTVPGQSYTVTFHYSARPGVPASSGGMEFWWDGQLIAPIALDGTSLSETDWHAYTFNLTATSTTTRLQFNATGTGDTVGAYLDGVSVRVTPSGPGTVTDQRGVLAFGAPDIGAFEFNPLAVTNTNDTGPGSLRDAILNANALGGGTITFAIGPSGSHHVIQVGLETSGAGLPAITSPVLIDG